MKTLYVPLGDVAKFINGKAFKPEEWEASGLPIIRIQNLTGSSNITNYYNGAFEPKYLVENGDVLISWSASLGVYIWNGGNAILNQHIFKANLYKCVDKRYFYYAAIYILDEMKNKVHGSTMQHITREPFESTMFPLPPLPEQQRIAAILQKADRLRRLRRYVRQLSDGYLQSVFLEMFGDPATNPKGWDCGSIDDVVAFSQYGTSNKSNSEKRGYPILGMINITYEGRVELDKLSCVELPFQEFKELRLERGDIIFNRTNSTELVGKTSYWNSDIDAVLASYLVKLKLKNNVMPEFFIMLLNSAYYKKLFQERCKKAVGQSNISPTLLKEFPVVIPPLELQSRLATAKTQNDLLWIRQRESERQAEHLFQSLLQRAFGGEQRFL